MVETKELEPSTFALRKGGFRGLPSGQERTKAGQDVDLGLLAAGGVRP
jgi:hypothetical protein